MSSSHFTLPSWPTLVEMDSTPQIVIVWAVCIVFICVFPSCALYHMRALRRLRFLMAIRRRYLHLLQLLCVLMVLQYMLVEPLRLFGGTYLSHLPLLYWIYFVCSMTVTHYILYLLCVRVYLFFYDVHWIGVCCGDQNQWRYHIYAPYMATTTTPMHASTSRTPSHSQHHRGASSMTFSNYQRHSRHHHHRSASRSTRHAHTKSKSKEISRLQMQMHEDQKDVEEDETASHPNIKHANRKLHISLHSAGMSTMDMGTMDMSMDMASMGMSMDELMVDDISRWVQYRQTFGNFKYVHKYMLCMVALSVILAIVGRCMLSHRYSHGLVQVLHAIPVMTMFALWWRTPRFNDAFLIHREMKLLLLYVTAFVVILCALNLALFLLPTSSPHLVTLQLVNMLVTHIFLFGAFMFLVSFPLRTVIALYRPLMMAQTSAEPSENRSSTAIEASDHGQRAVGCSSCRTVCCPPLSLLQQIAIHDSQTVGVNHLLDENTTKSHVKVASHSYHGHHLQREHALTEMVRVTTGTASKSKTKTRKNSDNDNVTVYHSPNAAEEDDDDDDMDEDTVVGMEAPDMLITGNEDDELEALNYDDGDGDGDHVEHTATHSMHIIAIKPAKVYTFDSSDAVALSPASQISPSATSPIGDEESMSTLRTVLSSNDGFQLLMTHCAAEWSIENILALIEIKQFREYCSKQETFIGRLLELRKKTAKERTAKKRQSIRLRKQQKQQHVKVKIQSIKQPKPQFNDDDDDDDAVRNLNADDDSDTFQTGHRRQTSRRGNSFHAAQRQKQALVRRRERLRQNQIDAQLMDDHEFTQHAFENRPPIQTAVSRTLQFMQEQEKYATHFSSSEHANADDVDGDVDGDGRNHDQEEKKDMEDTEAPQTMPTTPYQEQTVFVTGVHADDEDDADQAQESLLPAALNVRGYYDIIDLTKLKLPTSTIVNRPFIYSKNKRIQQLECIIIDLCNKYVLCASHFQLNLPAHIVREVKMKIQSMASNREDRMHETQHRRQPSQPSTAEADNNDDDANEEGLFPTMQSTESALSLENHEKLLPMFFDEILEITLRLMSDSLSRLKESEKFSDFMRNL